MKILISGIVLLILIGCALLFGPLLADHFTFRYRVRLIEQTKKLSARVRADSRDTNALNSLMVLLKSKDSWTRGQAAGALGGAGTNSEPALDSIMGVLNGEDVFSAIEAANSLGQIGPAAKRAIPDLIKCVRKYNDASLGWSAAESLGEIADPSDTNVLTILSQAASSPSENMRSTASAALHSLESRLGK